MTLAQYPGHLIAFATVAAVTAILVLAYRAPQWRRLGRLKWVLPVLQCVPIAMVVILLWDPARTLTDGHDVANTVLVLFDTSESMSLTDTGGPSRLDDAIAGFERAFQPANEGMPRYVYFGFDGSLHEVSSLDSLPRWGSRTSIMPALDLLRSQSARPAVSGGGRVAGAVVFTDGNAVEQNVKAIPGLDTSELPVLLVGTGADETHGDLAVTALDLAPRVRLDSGAPLRVALEGNLPADAPVTVNVTRDDTPIATRDVTGADIAKGATIDFVMPADTLGVHSVSVRATTTAPEATLANNTRQTTVEVVEEPRLRVLFYTQWANFDIGKLRQVLEREKKVALEFQQDALLTKEDTSRRGPYLIPQADVQFPSNAEALNAFDVVILGPCNPASFATEQVAALYDFVVERGGGFLLIPGQEDFDLSRSREPKLRALLPGELTPASAAQSATLQPTYEGGGLGLSALEKDKSLNDLSPYYAVIKKPAATAGALIGEAPAVLVQRAGRGHVALLNLRHLYRLYREDQEGGALRTLVAGLVTHLGAAAGDASRVQLLAERAGNDSRVVRFTVLVRDEAYQPASGATVLVSAGEAVARMDEAKPGEYRGEILTDGRDTLVARAEAASGGLFLGETTIAIRLPVPPGEMDHVARNRSYLEALAERIHAEYVDLEKLTPEHARAFPAVSTVAEVRDVNSAWRTWTCLIALCAMLTAGWFARRMMGLV